MVEVPAFVFEYSGPDAAAPDGWRHIRIVARAASLNKAFGLATTFAPTSGMVLTDRGGLACELADREGLAPGEARIVG